MDSWDVCLSEDFDFQYDTHEYNNNNIINKSKLIGCEFKPLLDNHTQEFESLDFKEIGFSDEISTDYNNVASSNDKGFSFSLVDLKLARFGDRGIGEEGKLSVANTLGSSIESSPRVKRSRSTRSCLESPKCQVHGCSKDLSSYKGYYKRNKVCNEHTRAARVIVSGMEQRFCQQCSRFHFLVEFDDGKRSCRKRLAEHNKRRRKPQFPSKSEALSTTTLDSGKFEALKWAYHVKTEDSVAENMKDISCNAEGNIINTSTCRKLDSSIIRQNSRARALSLLSSYSDNGTATPLLNTSPDIFKDIAQKGFHETATYSETDHEHPSMISSLHLPGDGTLRESDVRDTQSGPGIVLNLLQLSSRLQTIEQQKHTTEREAE